MPSLFLSLSRARTIFLSHSHSLSLSLSLPHSHTHTNKRTLKPTHTLSQLIYFSPTHFSLSLFSTNKHSDSLDRNISISFFRSVVLNIWLLRTLWKIYDGNDQHSKKLFCQICSWTKLQVHQKINFENFVIKNIIFIISVPCLVCCPKKHLKVWQKFCNKMLLKLTPLHIQDWESKGIKWKSLIIFIFMQT